MRIRKIIAILLVAIWAPMSIHCVLESFPGFEFLACAEVPSEQSGPASTDCCDDACLNLEGGQFFTPERRLYLAFDSILVFQPYELPFIEPLLPADHPVVSFSPELLIPSWHFCYRSALPIRAPSLVS